MTMQRTRARTDRFTLRGWTYAYHQLRDQGLMACLVPESDEPRLITLRSGQQVEIRKGDVAIIYPQIGWPVPPGAAPPSDDSAATTASTSKEALDRAADAVAAFKEAAAKPSPPATPIDDMQPHEKKPDDPVVAEFEPVVMPDMSPKLLTYHKAGETLREFVSRLTPELRRENNDLYQLVLYGSGSATLDAMLINVEKPYPGWAGNQTTVSERHGEISALLEELQRLGAEVELGPDAC